MAIRFRKGVPFTAMMALRPLPGILMILAAGIGLGLGYNALRPQPLPWVAKPLPQMKSLEDSTATSDSSLSALDHPKLIELGKDSTTSRVDRGHITTMPVQPPIGAIDSATPTVTKAPPSTAESTTTSANRGADTTSSVNSPPPATNASSDIPEPEDPVKINLSQTKRFFDRGGVVILDARDPEEYGEGHISGAL